jgi:hypothetical protein
MPRMKSSASYIDGADRVRQRYPGQRTAAPNGESTTSGEARVERVTGIEPASRAWKARALPLSYTRVMV